MFNSVNNFKPTRKVVYAIEAIRPALGTVVINKLEQPRSVLKMQGINFQDGDVVTDELRTAVMNGRTWWDPEDVTDELKSLVAEGKAYIVTEKNPIILRGTVGELWTIAEAKLVQKYNEVNGDNLNSANIGDEWYKVSTKPDNGLAYACFVPAQHQGSIQTSWAVLSINDPLVEHGTGDIVIAQANADGSINMGDKYVVNGLIYFKTYDQQFCGFM